MGEGGSERAGGKGWVGEGGSVRAGRRVREGGWEWADGGRLLGGVYYCAGSVD